MGVFWASIWPSMRRAMVDERPELALPPVRRTASIRRSPSGRNKGQASCWCRVCLLYVTRELAETFAGRGCAGVLRRRVLVRLRNDPVKNRGGDVRVVAEMTLARIDFFYCLDILGIPVVKAQDWHAKPTSLGGSQQ